jgi:flagellar hook protein FlgE
VTSAPSSLLEALETEAKAATATGTYRNGDHTAGTSDSLEITINDAFLTKYGLTQELGGHSTLKDLTVTVVFSGDTAYYGTTSTGSTIGPLDISDDALTELYGGVPTITNGTSSTVNLQAKYAAGLLVTEKTYTDGTETKYDFTSTDGTRTTTEAFEYADVSKFLASLTSTTQAQYTVTEADQNEEIIDGYYNISLLGMSDSEGTEVANWESTINFSPVEAVYDTGDGTFKYVGSEGNDAFTVNLSLLGSNFSNVSFDMSNTTNVNNGGKSTVAGTKDDGRKVGNLTGVSIGTDGVITASYDNGMQKDIAQIAVATFANAMGLENAGDNLYTTTANSGEFDGVGVDIKGSGTGYMTTGVLEMSNVDLATEFTNMITTQRGFQANSRIITTSDSLLEELVNLKR